MRKQYRTQGLNALVKALEIVQDERTEDEITDESGGLQPILVIPSGTWHRHETATQHIRVAVSCVWVKVVPRCRVTVDDGRPPAAHFGQRTYPGPHLRPISEDALLRSEWLVRNEPTVDARHANLDFRPPNGRFVMPDDDPNCNRSHDWIPDGQGGWMCKRCTAHM